MAQSRLSTSQVARGVFWVGHPWSKVFFTQCFGSSIYSRLQQWQLAYSKIGEVLFVVIENENISIIPYFFVDQVESPIFSLVSFLKKKKKL